MSSLNPNLTGPHQPEGQEVRIPTEGAELKAWLSRPAGVGSAPGVLVVHEARGLGQYVRDVADGLASSGYVAVALDLLSREGGTDSLGNPDRDAPPRLREIPVERHFGDLQSSLDWLKGQPGVSGLGMMGFSFGADLVWRMAARSPEVKAVVAFYGANPPEAEVINVRAAVYGVYGALDEKLNQGIDTIDRWMRQAGKAFEWKTYPYAVHSFHNHTNRAIYHGQSARYAWSDALTFLDKHLKAEPSA